MLYCEEEKHTLPSRGDTTRDSSVVYVLKGKEMEKAKEALVRCFDEQMKNKLILHSQRNYLLF